MTHRCFDEEQAVQLAAGLLEPKLAQRLVHGVESCQECSALLIEAGVALRGNTAPGSKWDLEVGEVLLGRYEIQRTLGRGGMGEVFAVFDRQRCEHVALKTIRSGLDFDPGVVARFRQELHLSSKVMHPNVVRVFDFGSFAARSGQSAQFYTMELVSGVPLSRWAKRAGPSVTTALGVLGQVAAGLSAIHELGIVHRDLKPENIMICDSPSSQQGDGTPALRAVVLDFGVARSSDRVKGLDTTSAGVRLGTPDYMAPEVLCGNPATTASDVYSFGLMAYELLTGRHPCPNRGTRAALGALRELHVPALTRYNPNVSDALSALVLQCLHADPEIRLRDAGRMLTQLHALV